MKQKILAEMSSKDEPPVDEADEALESLRMVFFLSPGEDREEIPDNEWEASVKKQLKIEKAQKAKFALTGILIYSVILFLAFWAGKNSLIKGWFINNNSKNDKPVAVENENRVIICGRLIFKEEEKPLSLENGKHYYPDLRLTCYFPDLNYQREFCGKNLSIEESGDYTLVIDLSGFAEKHIPRNVKVACCKQGYRECETKMIPLKSSPLTAYIPEFVMERGE